MILLFDIAQVHKKTDAGTKIKEMENKKSFNRISLSPMEIYEIHRKMWLWAEVAQKIYSKAMCDNEEADMDKLLKKLLQKTSATKALELMSQISKTMELPDLREFCTQEKFSGLLGVKQVANMTLSGLYFFSEVKNDVLSMFGRISIDYDRRSKLGLMLSEHDEIQESINKASIKDKNEAKRSVELIAEYFKNKRYTLASLLLHGKYIKYFLKLDSEPIHLGLCWTKIDCNVDKFVQNIYPFSHNNEDGGLFQYLCIVLFSLKF